MFSITLTIILILLFIKESTQILQVYNMIHYTTHILLHNLTLIYNQPNYKNDFIISSQTMRLKFGINHPQTIPLKPKGIWLFILMSYSVF